MPDCGWEICSNVDYSPARGQYKSRGNSSYRLAHFPGWNASPLKNALPLLQRWVCSVLCLGGVRPLLKPQTPSIIFFYFWESISSPPFYPQHEITWSLQWGFAAVHLLTEHFKTLKPHTFVEHAGSNYLGIHCGLEKVLISMICRKHQRN